MFKATNADTETAYGRLTRPRTRHYISLLLALLLGARAVAVQAQAAQVAQHEQFRAAVATEAMLHDWRANKTRENRLKVAEMAVALYLDEQAVPPDEIARRVRSFRDSVHASGVPGFTRAVVTAIGAGGGAAGAQAIATALKFGPGSAATIGGRTAMTVLGGYLLNSWYGGNDDLPEFRDLDVPLEGVVDEYVERYRTDADFRVAADATITPQWAFSPTDDIDTILEASPNFANSVNIAAIRAAIDRQGGLQSIAIDQLDKGQKEIAGTLDRLEIGQASTDQAVAQLESEVGSFVFETRERWATERARERDALDVANAQATGSLAATLIGLDNPELGRQVYALNRAVFGVHAGLKTYELAADLGANMGLATTALAGNFVGAALGLVDALLGAPSPEQVLMGQMERLSEQVEQMRQEMHQRFDFVDARLDNILTHVVDGFRVVGVNLDDISLELRTAQGRLATVIRGQRDIEELIVRRTAVLRKAISNLDLALAGCRITPPPAWETKERRDLCVEGFGALAESLELLQEGNGTGDVDQSVNIHFKELVRLIESTGRPSPGVTNVVGPDAWFWAAIELERYLRARPAYREDNDAKIASTVGGELRRRRDALRRYMDAIRNEMEAFQQGSETSAVALLLGEAREQVAVFRSAVSEIADEYYVDELRSGVRVRRNETGEVWRDATTGRVVPEVQFEDDAPLWRPLHEFYREPVQPAWWRDTQGEDAVAEPSQGSQWYTGGEYPAWLKLGPVPACGSPYSAYNMSEERFRGVAMNLLHADEMAPARLGMGDVVVCFSTPLVEQVYRAELYQIEMMYVFDYCGDVREGKRLRLPSYPHYPDSYTDYTGVPYEAATFRMIRDWMTYANERVAEASEGSARVSESCRRRYLARFEEKKRELADFLRQRLNARDGLLSGLERTGAGNDALRSWIAVAFDKAIGRSGLVDGIMSGRVALPDVGGMLEKESVDPWEIADEAVRRLDLVESVLRSRAMADVVEYGFGHRLLTETTFVSLGDVAQTEDALWW